MKRKIILMMISLFSLLGGCASTPSLFEVEQFCESGVKKYSKRDRDENIQIECKE